MGVRAVFFRDMACEMVRAVSCYSLPRSSKVLRSVRTVIDVRSLSQTGSNMYASF